MKKQIFSALLIVSLLLAASAEYAAALAGSPSPFFIRREGTTYFAQSQSTGLTYSGTLKFVGESAARDLNATGGGTITFLAGDFDFGSQYFKFDDLTNVIFQGQGMDVTIIRNSTNSASDTEPFNFTNGDFITIRDMTISAGGAARSTSDTIDFDAGDHNLVERVKITASRGRGIVFDGKDIFKGQLRTAESNTVRNCVISGVPSDGIEMLASSYNRIEGCQILNVGGHGIQVTKSSASADQPHKKSIGNTVTGNYVENSGQDGINVTSGDGNVITSNTVLNSSDDVTGRDGIRVLAADSIACNDNIVQSNTATDNQATKTQRYGLAISSSLCNRTVVADNNFVGNRVGQILDSGTGTIYTSLDTQPPSVPTGLAATLVSQNQVGILWNASTDNVGVASYTIYRDGISIGTVNGTTTTFQDNTVSPNTTYNYTVEAHDAAGNHSGQSTPLPVTTPPAVPDTEPPSIPTNLSATGVTYQAVNLSWSPSTDNVGVTGYTIYRDGISLNTVNGMTTTYQDSTVSANTSYTYTVAASDAQGNASGQSNGLPVTTPPAPSTFTFTPVADTFVNETSPTTNYGATTSLRTDASPIVRSYLRFNLQGLSGTITKVTLRVYANSANSIGYNVNSVADNTWTESTLIYNNAPAVGAVVGSSGPITAGTWTTVDITSLVTGNGSLNLALTSTSSTATSYASREAGANAPQLIVEVVH